MAALTVQAQPRRSGARLVVRLVALPVRLGWFVLRPVLAMAVGLATVVGVLVLAAVLLAHALH
jgi:hypothetical protein